MSVLWGVLGRFIKLSSCIGLAVFVAVPQDVSWKYIRAITSHRPTFYLGNILSLHSSS